MGDEVKFIGGLVKNRRGYIFITLVGALVFLSSGIAWSKPSSRQIPHLSIPVLGTALNHQQQPVGLVSQIVIDIHKRRDHDGLQIQFHTEPGQFSLLARKAIHQAITRSLHAAHLSGDSWTILLTFPYSGLTVYGESLSAMVGLSVVAMAKGEHVLEGRTLTGTITDHGSIGAVSGIQLKLRAAHRLRFQRVLVPAEYDIGDGDWDIPFLMHVSPVRNIQEAYLALTGHPLAAFPQ